MANIERNINKRKFEQQKNMAAGISSDILEKELELRKIQNPFPLDVFPSYIQPVITENIREKINRGYIGLSILVTTATITGSCVYLTDGKHTNYPSLWVCLVGKNSDQKSSSVNWFLRPLEDINNQLVKEQERKNSENLYEADLAEGEKKQKPKNNHYEDPITISYIEGEVIPHTLVQRNLAHNKRGCLIFKDELTGWKESFKSGRENFEPFWLSAWDNGKFKIRRAKGFVNVDTIVSVVGTTQFSNVPYFFGDYHNRKQHLVLKEFKSGFSARILFALDRQGKDFSLGFQNPQEIRSEKRWYNVINYIHKLSPEYSKQLKYTNDALDERKQFLDKEYYEIAKSSGEQNELLRTFLGKGIIYLSRFCIIIAVLDAVCEELGELKETEIDAFLVSNRSPKISEYITGEQMKKATKLYAYFKQEFISAYEIGRIDSMHEQLAPFIQKYLQLMNIDPNLKLNECYEIIKAEEGYSKSYTSFTRAISFNENAYPSIFRKFAKK